MSADTWTPPTEDEMRGLEERRKRSDEMSHKMSEMLLKGWKMLNEYCPVTGDVPLMQNRDGRKFSVALDKFIDEIDGDNQAPTGGTSADNTTAPHQQPPTSPAAAPAAPGAPLHVAVNATASPAPPNSTSSPVAAAQVPRHDTLLRTTSTAAPQAATAAAAAAPSAGAAGALDAALATVCAKLEQCTAQLAASSSAQESEQLVRIIGASAQTVRELRAAGAR